MNLDDTNRKSLVTAIEELTGVKSVYRRMSTCNYDIGEITVTKDSSIEDIIERLAEMGFTAEPESVALTVEIPNTLNDGYGKTAETNHG